MVVRFRRNSGLVGESVNADEQVALYRMGEEAGSESRERIAVGTVHVRNTVGQTITGRVVVAEL